MQIFKTNKDLEAFKSQNNFVYLLHLIFLGLPHFAHLKDNFIFYFQVTVPVCRRTTVASDSNDN